MPDWRQKRLQNGAKKAESLLQWKIVPLLQRQCVPSLIPSLKYWIVQVGAEFNCTAVCFDLLFILKRGCDPVTSSSGKPCCKIVFSMLHSTEHCFHLMRYHKGKEYKSHLYLWSSSLHHQIHLLSVGDLGVVLASCSNLILCMACYFRFSFYSPTFPDFWKHWSPLFPVSD